MTEAKHPELPPLPKFDFNSRRLILEHKLKPLIDERLIVGLENDHEVVSVWSKNSRGEADMINVVKFRVLFGVREYVDFFVTEDYEMCEDTPGATLYEDSWDGEKFTDMVRTVVKSKRAAVA